MVFQISYYLVLTFYIQTVYSQVTLSEEYPNGPPYFCEKTIRLRCQYSGASTCCSSSTRIWRKDTIQIMNDGAESSTTGKYVETINATAKYYELTIMNLDNSDFGKTYTCEYGFDKSLLELNIKVSRLECPLCHLCGMRCFGWGFLGILCAVGVFVVFYICWKPLDIIQRIALLITAISTLIGFFLSCVFAPFGSVYCFCYDYSDSAYNHNFKDPIYLGVFVLIVCAFAITYMCLNCTVSDCGCGYKEYHLWYILYVLTFGSLYLYKERNGYKANIGKTVELKCPYKAADKKKITWHKIDGKTATRYSEVELINAQLSQDLQLRLKVTGDHADGEGCYHLTISEVKESDTGTYECSLSGTPGAVYRLKLTALVGKEKKPTPV